MKRILLVVITLTLLGVLPAHAQERSPAPPEVELSIWRCQPNMAVRIWNRGAEDMPRAGWYLWEGERTYEPLAPIQAGYSVFIEHQTSQSIYLLTYDANNFPTGRAVRCYSVYLPVLMEVQP